MGSPSVTLHERFHLRTRPTGSARGADSVVAVPISFRPRTTLLAQSTDVEAFLGDDLLAWLLLAIGAALAVGTLLALLRPPPGDAGPGQAIATRPPVARSVIMIGIGLVAALWGVASLIR
jgi:hypothetical protein